MTQATLITRSTMFRLSRLVKTPKNRAVRLQSTSSGSASNARTENSHFVAGLAGGIAAGTILYGAFLLTPSGKMSIAVDRTVKEASKRSREAAKKLQSSTPNVDQQVDSIKQFCYSYIGWIPGGRQHVDAVFKEFEAIRRNYPKECEQILSTTYKQMQNLANSKKLNLEAISKAYNILTAFSKKLDTLTRNKDRASGIPPDHSKLKQIFGHSVDELKEMGEQYGPEAKKKVEDTWRHVTQIVDDGLSPASLEKAREHIEQQAEQIRKIGHDEWNKSMNLMKPHLEKNSQVKDLVERNMDALKHGSFTKLLDKTKHAVETGDIHDLEDYVHKTVVKAKSEGLRVEEELGLDQYFQMVPKGSEILPKLKHVKEVAEKHTDEGEKLLHETMHEINQVLEEKSRKAEDIVHRVKRNSR